MPRLILINGKPGVGKTTLLDRLRPTIDLPILTKDAIKEFLFDTIGFSNRAWSNAIGGVSVDMLYVFIERFLASGNDIVIENAFWNEYAHPKLLEICQKTETTCLELYCFTDARTRTMRNSERIGSPKRHPGHVDAELVVDDSLDDKRYAPLGIGQVYKIDTTHMEDSDFEMIKKTIKEFLSKDS